MPRSALPDKPGIYEIRSRHRRNVSNASFIYLLILWTVFDILQETLDLIDNLVAVDRRCRGRQVSRVAFLFFRL